MYVSCIYYINIPLRTLTDCSFLELIEGNVLKNPWSIAITKWHFHVKLQTNRGKSLKKT